jgi:hypothetical protein
MQISFEGFDFGSYLLGVATPFVVALIVAAVQTINQKKK